MLSYEIYKLIHVLGILLLFVSLGGVALHALNGGTKKENAGRKLIAGLHGVGTVAIILGGFGMAARLGLVTGLPGWVWAKVVIWLILGAVVLLPYRKPELARPFLIIVPLLGVLAAYLAIYKPL